MFYDLNLDDRTYSEIEADAVFHIPGEYPEWTNYNPSDPGITLIQLFSWLKEIQQYHLSRLSEWKRRKYLKLLGMRIRHIRPSRGAVNVEPGLAQLGKQLVIPRGSRFFAGDMAFETLKKEWVCPAKLIGTYMIQGENLQSYYNTGNDLEKKMRLHPFGEMPEAGNQCYFVLDQALSHEFCTRIYFDICTEYEVTRNPVKKGFIPLAELKWEYFCADGWEEIQVEYDHTCNFLQSGGISFRIPKEMVKDTELDAYQLRATLEKNDYDVAPLIQDVYLSEIPLAQQYSICDYEDCEIDWSAYEKEGVLSVKSSFYLARTGGIELYVQSQEGWRPVRAESRVSDEDGDVHIFFRKPEKIRNCRRCRLVVYEEELRERRIAGIGDAFANQEYDLHVTGLMYDEFELMVYDREREVFLPYHKTEDFDNCGPEDPVYILEDEEGRLLFGNCEQGMAPDGEIRIIRMKTSFGKAGNIKAGKIQRCEAVPGLMIKQYKNTDSGEDRETTDQCFERFRREMKNVSRGITAADYEELVKQTPGLLIQDSRVIPDSEWRDKENDRENRISIVVRPLSYKKRDARLSEGYRRNLEHMLWKHKMLGTRIQLLSPEYIGICVYAQIVIRPQFQEAERQMEEAVRSYLDEKTWEIGKPVLCSTIYGILDTLPCVWQVESLTIDARGKGSRRLVNGDVGLPPNGLAYPEYLDFNVSTVNQR